MGYCEKFVDTLKLILWIIVDPFLALGRCLCPKSKKNIHGEVVLITGAGRGLGKEIAIQLSRLDPVLVLWDINQENNEQTAATLRSEGKTVFSYKVDITNEEEVAQTAKKVKQDVGDVTILINNAGVFYGRPLLSLSNRVIRKTLEVNIMAHFWILREFLPRMMELDRGHIVAIASIAGHQGAVHMTDYCASKHGVVGLMESLYMELQSMQKENIKLTTINPVIIRTGEFPNLKTSKLPSLLPVLNVQETVKIIVKSILKEEEEVFIPRRVKWMADCLDCFSRRTKFRIINYMNYGFNPLKKKEPVKKEAEIV